MGSDRTAEADLPPDVVDFIAGNIDSVPQLETLLLLAADSSISWTVQQVARRIYVSEESAQQLLRGLQQRRLVGGDTAATGGGYRFSPPGDLAAGLIDRVVFTYQRNVVRVATLIHQKATSPVHEFARAFDLKKER